MSDIRYGTFDAYKQLKWLTFWSLILSHRSSMHYTFFTGMEDFMKKGESEDSYDICGHNDIRLPYNPCGCVYQMDIEEVDGWMSVTKARGYLCGNQDTGTNSFDVCDVNSM